MMNICVSSGLLSFTLTPLSVLFFCHIVIIIIIRNQQPGSYFKLPSSIINTRFSNQVLTGIKQECIKLLNMYLFIVNF